MIRRRQPGAERSPEEFGDQHGADAVQLAPQQRAQQRARGVAVQDDRVGAEARERGGDAGIVDMESRARETLRTG